MKIVPLLTLILFLYSCEQPSNKEDKDTITKKNISTTLSTDTSILSKLIDITNHKPTKAKFKYVFIDNSGQDDRITVPGPSDSRLEAILYLDSTTIEAIRCKYNIASYTANYEKMRFNFEWLDKSIKDELSKNDTTYKHDLPDNFFGTGQSGRLWLLNNKVLLIKSTN